MNNFITYEYYYTIPSDFSSQTILMIGRGNDIYKRFYLGVQAMEYIIKDIFICKMNIISNLSYIDNLEYLVNNLNLEKNINFVGYESSPDKYFKNSNLHIFPSISESFGLVLTESKIFGIPNILIGLDYISNSKGGTIIIYDDTPESIAKESIKILKNNEYMKIMGIEARKSMRQFKNNL